MPKALISSFSGLSRLSSFYTEAPCKSWFVFVHKSDRQKIRLIVDARQANQVFGSPPGVELCTLEGFA